jgi:hypothetical protein
MKAQADRYRHSLERFAYWVVVYEIIVVFLYAYFVRYDHKSPNLMYKTFTRGFKTRMS